MGSLPTEPSFVRGPLLELCNSGKGEVMFGVPMPIDIPGAIAERVAPAPFIPGELGEIGVSGEPGVAIVGSAIVSKIS